MGITMDEACPSCRHVGRDSTGNHLINFNNGAKFCNKCNFRLSPEGKVTRLGNFQPGEYEGEATEVAESTEFSDSGVTAESTGHITVDALSAAEIRGIPLSIVEEYGVKVGFDQSSGEVNTHFYPMTVEGNLATYKKRDCATKTFVKMQKTGGIHDFFGLSDMSSVPDAVVITEGELDAMSAREMLKSVHKKVKCISLPTGANVKAISDHLDFLRKIPRVVLCFDQDDAGQKNLEEAWKILPDVLVMEMPRKDANDMLKERMYEEFRKAYLSASKYKPRIVVEINDILDDIVEPVQMGLDYCFKELTDLTFGASTGSIIGIGAAPGGGKSSFLKAIQQHLMFTHGEKLGLIHPEETPKKTMKLLIGYMMNQPIHLPACVYDKGVARQHALDLMKLTMLYDHRYYEGWADIELAIRYFHSQGVRFFFIDPLSHLVSHLNPSDANTFLGKAMLSMSKLVQALDITIYHANHLKNPESGMDHGAGGRVYAGQFAGSRAMWKYSTDLWALERNQLSDDIVKRNTLVVRILKDRDAGNTGSYFELNYNKSKGILEEGSAIF